MNILTIDTLAVGVWAVTFGTVKKLWQVGTYKISFYSAEGDIG